MTQYRQRVEAGEHGELVEPVAQTTAEPAPDTQTTDEPDDLSALSVEELRKRAAEAEIEGRSGMNKDQLVEALS